MKEQIKVLFLDLDGVINSGNRNRADKVPHGRYSVNEAWREWHRAHIGEAPNETMIKMVQMLAADGWEVVVLSSRMDENMQSTHQQLKEWCVPYDSIILRHENDDRPPHVYKKEIIFNVLLGARMGGARGQFMLIDDDANICDTVREDTARWFPGFKFVALNVVKFS